MGRNYCPVSFFLAFFLFFYPGLAIFGETKTIEPFTIPSVRFSALGGNHASMGDTFHAIFTNPASFVDIQEQFSASELSLCTYGPVFELLDIMTANPGSLEDMDLTVVLGNGRFAAGFDMAGPISLGWVGKGLGLGIFNRIRTDAIVSGTKLRPGVSAEIMLVGGYSFRLINKNGNLLDAGFLGKGFFRGELSLSAPIFDALSLADDPLGQPFKTFLGTGLDLGLRYTFRENFAFSVVCFDVFSPVLVTPYDSLTDFGDHASPSTDSSYTNVKRRLDFGLRWRISNTFIDRYFTSLTIMADYHDLLDILSPVPRNPVLNAGVGLEMTVLNVLSFRFGVNDALPAFGLGLNLNILTLDMAIFGRELGIDPGRNSTYGLGIGVLFRY